MGSRLLVWLYTGIMLVTAPQAKAAWREAQSDHFVIYADDSEKDLRRFAVNLERYHRALELATGRSVPAPSPSNRVTIFVAGDQRDLRQVLDTRSRSIGGIYIPRAGASRAYVQDIRNRSGRYPHFSTVILLHEYAHHFLVSSSRFAMPRWMSEGAAEFFASALFETDGGISIGLPAQHRAGELYHATPVTVPELLDPELYEANRGRRYDAFYGRSWLLYHYLMFNDERAGQLDDYLRRVADGAAALEAGQGAFGDLDLLEREVDRYLDDGRMKSFTIAAEHLPVGDIAIRRLPKGEAKMMRVRMESQAGVTREQALDLVEDARKIAEDYPRDPGVFTALAEAEFDAGFDQRAIAAADTAIAIDPARVNAYVQKGYALFRIAAGIEDPKQAEAAFDAAMEPFIAVNQRENDHPIPLIHYYYSFAERGVEPPENARLALERAAQLAPFDQRLWFETAIMQAGEGKIELARASLQPLAANPHGGKRAEFFRSLIGVLDAAEEGEPLQLPSDAAAATQELLTDGDLSGQEGARDSADLTTDAP